jgi:glycine cleavage system aminomethyltransferase T
VAIVACHGDASTLREWRSVLGLFHVPIAPDEVWLIGAAADRDSITADARAKMADSLVVDQTDGWVAWTLAGPSAEELLARLMLAPMPAGPVGLVQGAIVGVPGKVLLSEGAYHVFVPAPVGHHFHDRAVQAGLDLDVRHGRPGPIAISVASAK